MNATRDRRALAPIILDVEASGFGRGSYPIEIGLAFSDGKTESFLIAPAPDWTHWDPAAERVHGIPRARLLDEGRSVLEIAALLNARLSGNRVYSDAWSFDTSWVGRLFDAAGVSQHFSIDTIRNLLGEVEVDLWQVAQADVFREVGPQRHRAAEDAARLQRTILRVQTLAGADAAPGSAG